MPLLFLVDEHLRGGALWHAIQRHNAGAIYPIDVVRVGDPPDLPLGSSDAEILMWAERQGRILVSRDVNTLPGHLAAHITAGHHSPGLFIIRPGCAASPIVAFLELAAYAADPAAYRDRVQYIP